MTRQQRNLATRRRRFVFALILLASATGIPTGAAHAVCSVIPPEGIDHRGFLGSLTSPLLTPNLTTDVRVVGAVCDQADRSTAPDFAVGGVPLASEDLVVTIAYTPADGESPAPLLVLAADPTVCDGIPGCSVDTTAERELVQVALPGGALESRLRFRYPSDAPAVGPARLGVRLAEAASPVATELRNVGCDDPSAGAYVACVGLFYPLDGSCRTRADLLDQPFSGLVAIPVTEFTEICTGGCEGLAPSIGTSTTLPITTDLFGNVLFGLDYEAVLLRIDRGDGQIEPRPRRLRLSVADAVENGFADDEYTGKPSSFTFEGARLSPPFNGFVDPTTPPGSVGVWGMVDAEAGVIFLPRRSCSDEPARSCRTDADCASGAVCEAEEFTFDQNGAPVELPIAEALAQQGVELNSWLDGSLTDPAVALAEDETIFGEAINGDGAADDLVALFLDRASGLLQQLAGPFTGRGLTKVRVVRGEEDFVQPALAAEDEVLGFLESEFAEGLADPIETTSGAEALAADVNGNGRLDQNLRLFALPANPATPQAVDLLPAGLELGVLADLRFNGRRNLLISEGNVFFAYSPLAQEPRVWELVNQSSAGEPGNFAAGQADLSEDGSTIAFTSTADNLVAGPDQGPLDVVTGRNTLLTALTSNSGDFPEVVGGQTIFQYEGEDLGPGPLPSRLLVELPICDVMGGELDLASLLNLEASGPNISLLEEIESPFPGSQAILLNRGIGKGQSQDYTLVFDASDVPAAAVRFVFIENGKEDAGVIRGPGCRAPLEGGIERVYARNVETGETTLVSGSAGAGCSGAPNGTNQPAGDPSVSGDGGIVFFETAAALTADDLDADTDIYAFDTAACETTNVSGDLPGAASAPTASADGNTVAFQIGDPAQIVVVDRAAGSVLYVGFGTEPDLSADGTQLVYTADQLGVSQVFLADLAAGTASEVVGLRDDDAPPPAGTAAPSVANDGSTAFTTPPADPDAADVFVRNVGEDRTDLASSVSLGLRLCTTSPCGAFSPSISSDNRFVAFVVRGLFPFDEIIVKDRVTGDVTPLSRMAEANGDSLDPDLGPNAALIAVTSFASQYGDATGAASPNVFLERPLDPSADSRALLGFVDLGACGAAGCTPVLTGEPVERGAVYAGDVAVVGSPVRVVQVGGGSFGVESFGREGSDVALSGEFVCALANTDALGNPMATAACGVRGTGVLADLTFGGVPIAATEVGLCGRRAVALGADGLLYLADLDQGFEAIAIQPAVDFEIGEDIDLDGDGAGDTCLVAFRSEETSLGGVPGSVGNRDLDTDDLAMYLIAADGEVTDCTSSTTSCPGQACQLLNYQVGLQTVLFITDEADENFGFSPAEDPCAPGTDINLDGRCGLTVRRCAAEGSLTGGTSFDSGVNLFSEKNFQNDGENTVIFAGFCGTPAGDLRIGQLCRDDLDCLTGETCEGGFVLLSALADSDGDEIPDVFDNCPDTPNPGLADEDGDGFGDACDTFTCGNGVVQEAESCDLGEANGAPGSACSADCECTVEFEVVETLKPGSNGSTPIIIFGSAAADGSGCVNLSESDVGPFAGKSIDPTSLRVSAAEPAIDCPTEGGAPVHRLDRRQTYRSHLTDENGDGLQDLRVHASTFEIGGDTSTTQVYLTGRFQNGAGGQECFVAVAPVEVSGN